MIGQAADDGIGKSLPSGLLVRTRLVAFDRKHSVEQENALFRPWSQVAMVGNGKSYIFFQLLVYILKRRRYAYALRHGEGKPHGLPGIVVGVLPQDHHLYFIERRHIEGVEDKRPGRVDRFAILYLLADEGCQRLKIRLFEFAFEGLFPALFNLDVAHWRGNCWFFSGKRGAENKKNIGHFSSQLKLINLAKKSYFTGLHPFNFSILNRAPYENVCNATCFMHCHQSLGSTSKFNLAVQ